MRKAFYIADALILTLLTSCTVSMTMVHTEGEAHDVVDEQQTTKPTVSPDIKLDARPF